MHSHTAFNFISVVGATNGRPRAFTERPYVNCATERDRVRTQSNITLNIGDSSLSLLVLGHLQRSVDYLYLRDYVTKSVATDLVGELNLLL